MAKKQKQKLSSLTDMEWVIMGVVWDQEPCTAGTVQEALAEEHAWAYSTIKTTMDRMVVKGLLSCRMIRNLNLFSSKINRDEAKRGELRRFLSRAFNGALTPMIEFLIDEEELSADELKQLRKIINRADQRKQ